MIKYNIWKCIIVFKAISFFNFLIFFYQNNKKTWTNALYILNVIKCSFENCILQFIFNWKFESALNVWKYLDEIPYKELPIVKIPCKKIQLEDLRIQDLKCNIHRNYNKYTIWNNIQKKTCHKTNNSPCFNRNLK